MSNNLKYNVEVRLKGPAADFLCEEQPPHAPMIGAVGNNLLWLDVTEECVRDIWDWNVLRYRITVVPVLHPA